MELKCENKNKKMNSSARNITNGYSQAVAPAERGTSPPQLVCRVPVLSIFVGFDSL